MRTKIIAELASCHNGDFQMLEALVKAAAKCGADVVKVQDWRASNVKDDDPDKARYERYEFRDEWYPDFIRLCEENGVEPLTSCFNKERVGRLKELGFRKVKLASVCLTNHDLLIHAGAAFDEIIASTGMSTREEIEEAADALASCSKRFTLMHCVANYPCRTEDANLGKMKSLINLLEGQEYASVGYSNHSLDVDVTKMAMALGPEYVEVHFSLSRLVPQVAHQMFKGGPLVTTHEVSLEPSELADLCSWRDKLALAWGTGEFSVNEVEGKIRDRYAGRYGK